MPYILFCWSPLQQRDYTHYKTIKPTLYGCCLEFHCSLNSAFPSSFVCVRLNSKGGRGGGGRKRVGKVMTSDINVIDYKHVHLSWQFFIFYNKRPVLPTFEVTNRKYAAIILILCSIKMPSPNLFPNILMGIFTQVSASSKIHI